MRSIRFTVFSSILLALIGGCRPTVIENGESGRVTGRVVPYGFVGDSLTGEKNGIIVQIDGTPLSTQTDSNGGWSISGVPPGNYYIYAYKPGFDSSLSTYEKSYGVGTDVLQTLYSHKRTTDSVALSLLWAPSLDSGRMDSSTYYLVGRIIGNDTIPFVHVGYGITNDYSHGEWKESIPVVNGGFTKRIGFNRVSNLDTAYFYGVPASDVNEFPWPSLSYSVESAHRTKTQFMILRN